MKVEERFLNYVGFDTQSDEYSETSPSTAKQLELGRYVKNELENIGLENVSMDEFGYVYGHISASEGCETDDAIGLMSHMDTSPDAPGANIKTRTFLYEGGDIILNDKVSIDAKEYDLDFYKGQTLIATDGTTLLGADDKAGIAEIVTVCENFINNPGLKHGPVYVAFTPDEEIGRGTEHINLEKFPVKYAYTLDGGRISEIEFECFNAAGCKIVINGMNIHPGAAKNKMKNSVLIANEFISMLPPAETPAHTEGYEGFYHVAGVKGDETQTTVVMIIRDHDRQKFENKKNYILHVASYLNEKYGKNTVEVLLKDTYYNMREKVEPYMFIVEKAQNAFKALGVDIKPSPIRGGTDGAALSYMGIPCPNLPTGGENYHSVKEFVSVDAMNLVVKAVTNMLKK